MITKEDVASRIRDYLQHRLKLDDLVAWAEQAMQEEEFETSHFERIRHTVARLGVADVRPFGLTWTTKRKSRFTKPSKLHAQPSAPADSSAAFPARPWKKAILRLILTR